MLAIVRNIFFILLGIFYSSGTWAYTLGNSPVKIEAIIDRNPPNGTQWATMTKCGELYTPLTGVLKKIVLTRLREQQYQSAHINCSQLTSDGELSGYRSGPGFFYATDTSGVGKATTVSDGKLPVGVRLAHCGERLADITLLTQLPYNIPSSDYPSHQEQWATGDYSGAGCDVVTRDLEPDYVMCPDRYVLTGFNVQYNLEGGYNDNEKGEIRGIKIQCREFIGP